MSKPIIIINRNDQLRLKRKHPFFKTDVLYYTNHKTGVDVYYDSTTYLLLGYKERNKEYAMARKTNRYLKIQYSISNRLKLLGYSSKYIDISGHIGELERYYEKKTTQDMIKEIVSIISRNRIINLKKTITDIQRFIYRIKYKFEQPEEKDEDMITSITKKYMTKLEKIKLKDKNNKNKVFKDWKAVYYNLFFQSLENKTVNLSIETKEFLADEISENDYHGNLILYYIVRELGKLFDYNDNKFMKINTAYFILDMIINEFNLFNKEDLLTNYEIKRFNYILTSKTYIFDIEEKGHGLGGEIEGFYGEHRDEDDIVTEEQIEQKDIDLEEIQALDIEQDLDYEIDYMAGVNKN